MRGVFSLNFYLSLYLPTYYHYIQEHEERVVHGYMNEPCYKPGEEVVTEETERRRLMQELYKDEKIDVNDREKGLSFSQSGRWLISL